MASDAQHYVNNITFLPQKWGSVDTMYDFWRSVVQWPIWRVMIRFFLTNIGTLYLSLSLTDWLTDRLTLALLSKTQKLKGRLWPLAFVTIKYILVILQTNSRWAMKLITNIFFTKFWQKMNLTKFNIISHVSHFSNARVIIVGYGRGHWVN